jgi:hypothetical protein
LAVLPSDSDRLLLPEVLDCFSHELGVGGWNRACGVSKLHEGRIGRRHFPGGAI